MVRHRVRGRAVGWLLLGCGQSRMSYGLPVFDGGAIMVAPLVGAALVSGAASLLGGLFGRKDAKKNMQFQAAQIAAQNEYNKPINIRARAEEGGFNPLLFAGPGVGLQTGVAEYVPSGMGNAIANAGLALASGITDQANLNAYNSKLAEQNAELRKALETATLRPEVPGIYGTSQSVSLPAVPTALDAGSVSGAGFDIGSSDTRAKTGVAVIPPAPVEATPLMQTYEYDGETLTAPSFIDVDELLSGAAAMAAIAYKKATKAKVVEHIAMKARMYHEKAKNDNMVNTIRAQGRTEPLGAGASRMPSKTPWWLTR